MVVIWIAVDGNNIIKRSTRRVKIPLYRNSVYLTVINKKGIIIMQKGAPINIREIHNGVMIEPAHNSPGVCTSDKEIIAFQDAESFINWIKQHFSVYTIPKWDNDNE